MPYTASSTAPLHVLINPFAWLLWAIDFLLWVLLNPLPGLGPLKMLLSLVRGQVSREEKTGQRLNVLTQGEPINQLPGYPDITTVHEMMQLSFAKYAKCVARALRPRARPQRGNRFRLARESSVALRFHPGSPQIPSSARAPSESATLSTPRLCPLVHFSPSAARTCSARASTSASTRPTARASRSRSSGRRRGSRTATCRLSLIHI